ncbi:MAG: hypothetical protein PVJ09_02310 [Candidatus Woesebacteria bacterium]|jgi:hypothetical protein
MNFNLEAIYEGVYSFQLLIVLTGIFGALVLISHRMGSKDKKDKK